ncbi:hypothetical protein [Moraxella porci]|uniref:hypothetical protein n=1 Tax=Moraxella porci TaxID=1288392 RepID=UPI00244C685D|nr:hypothetical protein [Moraxella porci]MDH2273429.1 hypothetical protein [Moraxella porci]
MKKLALSTLLSVAVLTGCTTVQNSINAAAGVPVGQKTTEYVVSGAGGILAELSPQGAEKSSYRYGFAIDLKAAESVRSVKIERLNDDGSKTLIIDDSQSPTKAGAWQTKQPNDAQSYLSGKGIGNVTWVGQSQSFNMTPAQAPWLYKKGNAREKYLITITDLNGKVTTLTQPAIIPQAAKSTYLQLIN